MEKMFYHRVNGDLYESDYVDMFEHDEIPLNDYCVSWLKKLKAVERLESALIESGVDEFGSLRFDGFSYHVYRCLDSGFEFVQVFHDEESCTMIPVTGDSLNALLRDLMRAGLN